jgi:hypothetical protein
MLISEDMSQNKSIKQETQEKILRELQAENMRKIVASPNLFRTAINGLKNTFPEKYKEGMTDSFLGVHVGKYGTRLPSGEWDEGTAYYISDNYEESSSFLPVARVSSVHNGEGATTFSGEFTPELLDEVIELTKPLELAKLSGQLPDLTPSLDRIYIPVDHPVGLDE